MFKPKPSKPVLFAITFKQISALKGIAQFTFKHLYMLKSIALVVFLSFVFGIVYVFSATPLTASAATTNTINFQARLETAAGGIVTDGTYNVEFKIYNTLTSSGSSQGSCTGDAHCLWTEDYLVSASQGVAVSNGYMTVNLGSITAFPSTIPWGTPLYLTINIGGTGTPSWDGEMAPRLALTAVPAAFSLESAAGSYTSTLTFQQPTASESIYLPAEAGATNYVCYQNDTNCGFESTTGTNFIQNQNASAQTANYDITGEGQVGTLDAEGTGTANILTIGSSASTTGSIKIANTATSGSVIIGGTATTGTITVGEYDGASTNTIDIGDGATTGTQTINIGAAAGSGGTNNITIGSSTGSSTVTTIQGGTGSGAIALTTGTNGSIAITANGTGTVGLYTNSSSSGTLVKTSTNSATGFQVQNASGYSVLTVDTTTTNQPQGEVLLGKLSTNNGALAFANSSNGNLVTIKIGATSTAYSLTLPTALGSSGNCLDDTTGGGVLGWTTCGGGGSTTTLQQAYNNSAGATPNIDVQGTGGSDPYGGVTIQDDNSHGVTTGNNLFSVNAGAGSGLGSTLFGVNTYGDSTITSSDTSGTALNTTGTDISTGDVATFTTPLTGGSIDDLTSGNVVNIASSSNVQSGAGSLLNVTDTATLQTNGGTDTGSLVNVSRALTADVSGGSPIIDTSGTGPETIDETAGTDSYTTSYTVSASHSNTFLLVEVADSVAACGQDFEAATYNTRSMSEIGCVTNPYSEFGTSLYFFGLTNPATGSNSLQITTILGAYMQISVSDWYNVNQTTPYNSSGVGSFTTNTGTTSTASLSASSGSRQVIVDGLDAQSSVSTIASQNSGQTFMSDNDDDTFIYQETADSYKTAGSGSTTTMGWSNIPNDGAPGYAWAEASIGLNGLSESLSSPVASISNSCSITAGACSDATSVLSLDQAYSNAGGAVLDITNAGYGDMLDLVAGSTTVTKISDTGTVLLENSSNSASAFVVQNSGGTAMLTVSTNGSQVVIGSGTVGDTSPVLLVLDNTAPSGTPTEVNGAMYYNTTLSAFECGVGGSWLSCVNGVAQELSTYSGDSSSTTTTTPVALGANHVQFAPLYVPGTITVADLYVDVAVTFGASGGDVGIYNSSGDLVMDGGSGSVTDSPTTGLKTVAMTAKSGYSLTLSPGQYYVAVTCTTSTCSVIGSAVVAGQNRGVGNVTGGGAVLPSTITPGSTGTWIPGVSVGSGL